MTPDEQEYFSELVELYVDEGIISESDANYLAYDAANTLMAIEGNIDPQQMEDALDYLIIAEEIGKGEITGQDAKDWCADYADWLNSVDFDQVEDIHEWIDSICSPMGSVG